MTFPSTTELAPLDADFYIAEQDFVQSLCEKCDFVEDGEQKPVTYLTTLEEVNWDSLASLTAIIMFSSDLSLNIQGAHLKGCKTFRDIYLLTRMDQPSLDHLASALREDS